MALAVINVPVTSQSPLLPLSNPGLATTLVPCAGGVPVHIQSFTGTPTAFHADATRWHWLLLAPKMSRAARIVASRATR